MVARQQHGALLLRVIDTEPGIDTTDRAVVLVWGTGLANVHEHLQHFFDGAAALHLRPQRPELRLPLQTMPSTAS